LVVASRPAADRPAVVATAMAASAAAKKGGAKGGGGAAATTPDYVLITSSYDNTMRFWDVTTARALRSIPTPDSQVNRLAVTPDGTRVVAAANPHVRMYDIEVGKAASASPVATFDAHAGNVCAVGFAASGAWMYTAGEDAALNIWDVRAPPRVQRRYECAAAINTAALHPNQAEVVAGDDAGNVRIFDLTANQCSRELVPAGEVAVRALDVAPDGTRLVVCNSQGECFVWRLGDGEMGEPRPVQRFAATNSGAYVLRVRYSPDASALVTCGADHLAKLWTVRDDGVYFDKQLGGHERWVWDATFSDDNAFVLTCSSDTTVRLWQRHDGDTARTYFGHQRPVVACAFASRRTAK